MIVYYDGVCALCNRFVLWALRRDPERRLRFAALQSPHGEQLRRDFPETRSVDSIIVLDGERPLVKSDAVFAIARELHARFVVAALRITPRRLRDWGYDRVARRRYQWFGQLDACPLPPPERRHQFL